MSDGQLATVPIHRVMNRAMLFAGGDRELMLSNLMVWLILAFTSLDAVAIALSLIMCFLLTWLLRVMAKSDPQMRHVYLRHIRYRAYYPARSRPWRLNPKATWR